MAFRMRSLIVSIILVLRTALCALRFLFSVFYFLSSILYLLHNLIRRGDADHFLQRRQSLTSFDDAVLAHGCHAFAP